MKLATIVTIKELAEIKNADRILLATMNENGWQCVVSKDKFKVGDRAAYIAIDSILPDKEWTKFYKSKSSRIKSLKLKNCWSQGVLESLSVLELPDLPVNTDVTEILGITKWEAPVPQQLDAKGNLRFGLFKTDETNFQSLDSIPYGEEVIVSAKKDGQSGSYFCKVLFDNIEVGITSRSLELKPECPNNFTAINNKYNILEKLREYCVRNKKSLCIRGEVYGVGIQSFKINPDCKVSLNFAAFNVLNMDTLQYEPFDFCLELCKELGIPTVEVLERAILTPELIKKYKEDLEKINGQFFEGCVFKLKNGGSFKVINVHYDQNKY